MQRKPIGILMDPEEVIDITVFELDEIAKKFQPKLIPAENYFIVQDRDNIGELPRVPVFYKDRPNDITMSKVKHVLKAKDDKYADIVNDERAVVSKFKFRKDIFFGKYLLNLMQEDFIKLKKGLHRSDLNKALIDRADNNIWVLTEQCLDAMFQRYDVANYLYELKQTCETHYLSIAQHVVNTTFLTIYFGLAYVLSHPDLRSEPRCQPDVLGKTLGLGSFFHDYGVENILMGYEFGSQDFIKSWGDKGEVLFGLITSADMPIESKVMLRYQNSNLIEGKKNYGFHTKVMQVANALDSMMTGKSIVKVGSYHEFFDESRAVRDAMAFIIVHSRPKRHEFDAVQIFDPDIVEFVVNLCDYRQIWNYHDMLKTRIREGKCGRCIISPNEMYPVTALCPTPGKTCSECSGTSATASIIHKNQHFYRCRDLHDEINRLNEEFKNKV